MIPVKLKRVIQILIYKPETSELLSMCYSESGSYLIFQFKNKIFHSCLARRQVVQYDKFEFFRSLKQVNIMNISATLSKQNFRQMPDFFVKFDYQK
ncbi:MAG: hypothetical protein D8M26_16260 [Ignavibacteriae bacterium]|nr:hypothetical protein [Ignavibacteriota bacterium]MCE7857322.1 hypothetical protein [Ignavibacteria bacterium CHB3]